MPKSFFGEEEQKDLEKGISKAMESEREGEQLEEVAGEQAEVEKIRLGETEYTQDELQELVGLGSKAREVGESHGGFDKFVSEFGKKSQRIGELKSELEKVKTSSVTPTGELTDEATRQAQEAARKLGIVLTDDVKSMVAEILDKEFDGKYSVRRSGEKLLEQVKSLETEIDGEDGRPKFESEKVLTFMQENPGITDPQRAYEAMNLDKIAEWKAEQILKSRKTGITTTTSTQSNKMPPQVSVNRDNLHELMTEALNS